MVYTEIEYIKFFISLDYSHKSLHFKPCINLHKSLQFKLLRLNVSTFHFTINIIDHLYSCKIV